MLRRRLGDNGYGDFEMTGNTWTYTLNNSLPAVQALGAGQTLTDTYTFLASDGSSQEVTITIDGTDDPSVIGGIATGSVSEDTTLTTSNTLTITDVDTPDTPSFTDVLLPDAGDNGYGRFHDIRQYLDLYAEQRPGSCAGTWRRAEPDRYLHLRCQRRFEPGSDDHDQRHRRPVSDRRHCHRFGFRGYQPDGNQYADYHRCGHA